MGKCKKSTFSKIVERAKELKILLALVTTAIVLIFSFTAYVATSSDLEDTNIVVAQNYQEFSDYKAYQLLEYLDKRLLQLEERYDCYDDSCRRKMPLSVWEDYIEKGKKQKRLEGKLYPKLEAK